MANKALEEMMEWLTGQFDNQSQLDQMPSEERTSYPYARHINTQVNDRIDGLPADFAGIFLLEESYYTVDGKTNAMPHLFLFTQQGDAVCLTSYEMSEGYTKETFTAQNLGRLNYALLKPSEKFTPALYQKEGDWYVGGSVSMFTPVLKFTLSERFSKDLLEVQETMEVNGRRTFGYDRPLEYRRIRA